MPAYDGPRKPGPRRQRAREALRPALPHVPPGRSVLPPLQLLAADQRGDHELSGQPADAASAVRRSGQLRRRAARSGFPACRRELPRHRGGGHGPVFRVVPRARARHQRAARQGSPRRGADHRLSPVPLLLGGHRRRVDPRLRRPGNGERPPQGVRREDDLLPRRAGACPAPDHRHGRLALHRLLRAPVLRGHRGHRPGAVRVGGDRRCRKDAADPVDHRSLAGRHHEGDRGPAGHGRADALRRDVRHAERGQQGPDPEPAAVRVRAGHPPVQDRARHGRRDARDDRQPRRRGRDPEGDPV